MKKQITLSNGNTVQINPNLNAYVLFELEKEGVITKTFMGSLFATNTQNIDVLDAIRTVYAAYRQATPTNYLSFDEFMKLYQVDMTEAVQIFMAIVKRDQKNNMAGGFNRKNKQKKA